MKSSLQYFIYFRFVTSVVKIPQAKYYTQQSMVDLASEIGLPSYFVHLRNEIVHGHGGWGGGDTIKCAVDSCFSWIMVHYLVCFDTKDKIFSYLLEA